VRCVLAPGGEARVALRNCPPYTLWDLETQAAAAGLRRVGSVRFMEEDYPGYSWVPTKVLTKHLAAKRKSKAKESISTIYMFKI